MEFSGTWGSFRKTPFLFHLFQYINTLKGSTSQRSVLKDNIFQFLQGDPGTKATLAGVSILIWEQFNPFPKGAVLADMLLLSNDEETSPEMRGCLSHRQAIPRLLGPIQNQLKHMESPSTDSKKVWIRPKHQSQHHKLCLEANTQPSTIPSAEVSCAYSEIPNPLSRMLPSALAPHFPGDLAPVTALQWITAPRSTAAREGHNPHCQAEMGEEKRTKINKPTKFLWMRNRDSELCAK